MVKDYAETQAKKHYALWEEANEKGDEKLAEKHMAEYLNYQEMLKSVED